MEKSKTRTHKKPKYVQSEDDCDYSDSLEVDTKKKNKKQIPIKKNPKLNKRKKELDDDEDDDEFLPEYFSDDSPYTEGEDNSDSMSAEDVSVINQKEYLNKKKMRNNSMASNIPNGIAVKEKSSIKETNQKEIVPKPAKKEKFVLDPNFNLDASYFYQDVTKTQWDQIRVFILNYLKENKADNSSLKAFFSNYPNLKKGEHNIVQLRKM